MNEAQIYWRKLLPNSPTAVRCCQRHVTCGPVRQRYTLALPRGCMRFHPRTAQHTITRAQAQKTHAGTCDTNTDALAHTHTKTHTHMQCWRFHTQTHIGVLCRSGALPPVQTHTHSHAERGGQMESQRGLLAFHTPET